MALTAGDITGIDFAGTLDAYNFVGFESTPRRGVHPQAKVVVGCLKVASIEAKTAAAKVTFDIEGTGLKYAIGGYVLMRSEAYAIIQAAHASDTPVLFRIEGKRKAKANGREVSMETPYGKLNAATEASSAIVAAGIVETGEYAIVSEEMRTSPAEDAMRLQAKRDLEVIPDFLPVSDVPADAAGGVVSEDVVSQMRANLLNGIREVYATDRTFAGQCLPAFMAQGFALGATVEDIVRACEAGKGETN